MSGTHIRGERDHGPLLTEDLRRADIDPPIMTLQTELAFQQEHNEPKSEILALADELGSTAWAIADVTPASQGALETAAGRRRTGTSWTGYALTAP